MRVPTKIRQSVVAACAAAILCITGFMPTAAAQEQPQDQSDWSQWDTFSQTENSDSIAEQAQIKQGDPADGTLNGETALGDPMKESKTDSESSNGKLYSTKAASGTLPIPRTVIFQQSAARSMLGMVNSLRSGAGRSSLQWDTRLEEIAMQRAAEITEYFAHTRPNGQQPFTVADDLGYGNQIFVALLLFSWVVVCR